MIRIRYNKQTGIVFGNRVGGQNIDEQAIGELIIEALPDIDLNYKWLKVIDDKLTVYDLSLTDEEMQLLIKQKNSAKIDSQINNLKAQLAATDYQAIKFAEGGISEADYAPIKQQRAAWRAEINELEKELLK